MIEGKITRIAGPVIYAQGLDGCGLYDVVDVGEKKLIGEIIRQNKGNTTIQVYEDGTGMHIGEKVVCTERPLSLRLGPGVVGNIYDGIQRPLQAMYENSGAFLLPGERADPLDVKKVWHFEAGDDSEGKQICKGTAIKPGMSIGTVKETESITEKIMIPPYIRGRSLASFKGTGDYTVDDVIATTELGEDIKLSQYWPVRQPRPFTQKLGVSEPLITGQRVIDVFFPLSKGGTAAIPGGFGTGKTMTQHAVAKWCDADLIVYIGCGERGNEMTEVLTEFPELIDPRTGRSIMERTILIANTSNMPVAAREVSLYSGITLAEYFRDMGMAVAIMADSTSRWAEALRELSGRMEEMPAEEGFPAYLPTRLASFYERAGRVISLEGQEGSVSVIGAVSPPGGDFSEPVTQHTKRFIRCFWALDRELANARHYPAIGWIDSYSEYADEVRDWWEVHNPLWGTLRQKALELLKNENKLEQIVRLIGPDALPNTDRLVLKVADMIKNGFLQQNAFDDVDKYCSTDKQIGILELILEYYERALNCIKGGATLQQVSTLPVCEEITRIKMTIPNDKLEKIQDIKGNLDKQIGEVERLYKVGM
ncbi:V-type ATP synthase subunit A [Treponema sp. Marseille-Q3903]|uniref:V-type ATP synthase subunit A n=1 Tax=Treponema sp. Marseille-Q3903 TaxID=2766703 RepID=UPI001651CF1B|nr:V-type ATP synthase subunit A [Treponema sp. Marseille-Q3903]MBC6714186.1 V-type ATP synthase subunit A [Treponema sp. Marseille-Q3903]